MTQPEEYEILDTNRSPLILDKYNNETFKFQEDILISLD